MFSSRRRVRAANLALAPLNWDGNSPRSNSQEETPGDLITVFDLPEGLGGSGLSGPDHACES